MFLKRSRNEFSEALNRAATSRYDSCCNTALHILRMRSLAISSRSEFRIFCQKFCFYVSCLISSTAFPPSGSVQNAAKEQNSNARCRHMVVSNLIQSTRKEHNNRTYNGDRASLPIGGKRCQKSTLSILEKGFSQRM